MKAFSWAEIQSNATKNTTGVEKQLSGLSQMLRL